MLRASVVVSLAYAYAVPQLVDLLLIFLFGALYAGFLWLVIRQG